MAAISVYLSKVESALKAGGATEHTHRPALKTLIEALRKDIIATNEPKRIACGSPDFIVTQKGTPLGYVEAKDVGISLDKAETSDQLVRYQASLRNLILTDYLEFRLYRSGELIQTVRLGTPSSKGVIKAVASAEVQLLKLFTTFFDTKVPSIASPRELAERMARMAHLLHDLIRIAYKKEGETGDFHSQHEAFRKILITDLSVDQFADMYAQTIAYGLFAARFNHDGEGFTREHAGSELPKTNPFLRRLFNTIAGPDLDDRISWAVDDLAKLLSMADISAILSNFGKATRREDPIVHFYETFLKAYDPKLRELRGVYYTPEPVVDYMVKSVDELLKRDFSRPNGLADSSKIKLKRLRPALKGGGKPVEETYETHRVQILDPACGTGTFLHSIIGGIHEGFAGNGGMWPGYVANHLLPRVYGFELLMPPYAVAHMKLGLQLKESDYDFASDERLRVYLTNTLERAHEMTGLPLFTQWLADEAAAAGEVKQNVPIMVVIGNPPYSGHSANKGKWIEGLMKEYKTSPELKKRGQAKWLSDDYVKFLRFSQWRIEQTGYGILAFITNHSFLSNPTFLDMRKSLMTTFDDLYLLDLHGSSKPKERAPGGITDQNVFDIQKGVAISLFVRRTTRAKSATVRRADVWGTRAEKYAWLEAKSVLNTKWKIVTPKAAPWFFHAQDAAMSAEYKAFMSVADIFKPSGDPAPGIVTTQDKFAIAWTKDGIIDNVDRLLATSTELEARELFRLCRTSQWSYAIAKAELANGKWRKEAVQVMYRPFDMRWTIWDSNIAVHRRERVMSHMLKPGNIGLITNRQVNGDFRHSFVASGIIGDCAISSASKERSYLFPLYIVQRATEKQGKLNFSTSATKVNLSKEFLQLVAKTLGKTKPAPTPEMAFAYLYALLASPKFRERYNEFLRRDFPRVPVTSDAGQFRALSKLGQQLIDLHLMVKPVAEKIKMPVAGNSRIAVYVAKPHPKNKGNVQIFINKTQYFDDVPQVAWEYMIGGYQVARQWLKDRKGMTLSYDEQKHFSTIVEILVQSDKIQKAIDDAIPTWPIPT